MMKQRRHNWEDLQNQNQKNKKTQLWAAVVCLLSFLVHCSFAQFELSTSITFTATNGTHSITIPYVPTLWSQHISGLNVSVFFPSVAEGCDAQGLSDYTASKDKAVVVLQGICGHGVKYNAIGRAGGVLVVYQKSQDDSRFYDWQWLDPITTTYDSDAVSPNITIPAIYIGNSDGERIRSYFVTGTVRLVFAKTHPINPGDRQALLALYRATMTSAYTNATWGTTIPWGKTAVSGGSFLINCVCVCA